MPIQENEQTTNLIADEAISVTIDVSDLNFASAEPLSNILSRYGRPASARAFGDFQQAGVAELAVQLYQMGFTLVHCPTWPNGDGFPKTVVSDVMAQDLRDQLEELEGVETYIVVATSRDYIAVTNALRRHDRRVVVVAEEGKVCRELRMCADEFAILPPTRAERRSETLRIARMAEAARATKAPVAERSERVAEVARVERLAERPVPEKLEQAERPAEPVAARSERPTERPTRQAGRSPAGRSSVERPAPERADGQDGGRLPADVEVLAEVRRIVAAEGICTPRRLGRALCPVDRTPTGELRSRIANRIQALVDAGKLVRERLVVGGTSVETILLQEDRASRLTQPSEHEEPAVVEAATSDALPIALPEPVSLAEPIGGDGLSQEEAVAEIAEIALPEPSTIEAPPKPGPREEKRKARRFAVRDLDALVESVLKAPELAAGLRKHEPEPEPVVEQPEAKPKRTRSRRKPAAKASTPEPNGASAS